LLILGADEAGRGPIISNLVLCAAQIDNSNNEYLTKLGVKDSKELTPAKRELLFEKLVSDKIIKYELAIVPPSEIDKSVLSTEGDNLNWLEAKHTANLINKFDAEIAYIDCPHRVPQKYSDYINKLLIKKTKLVSEHKADSTYPIVSAASILAKVTRDRLLAQERERIRIDFGSGYLGDPKTKKFLNEHWKDFPDLFRKSWKPYQEKINGTN